MQKEKIKIRVVIPNTSKDFLKSHTSELKKEFPDIEVVSLSAGPESVEDFLDEVVAGPDTVRLVKEAEEKGFDAVVISCFANPAIDACRSVVSIPVVGAGIASLLVASSLGERIAIVTVLKETIPTIEHSVKVLGLTNVASVRAASIGVLEIEKDREKTLSALLRESLAAIEENGADVIALGCTGMAGIDKKLMGELKKRGYEIPVIDPARAAIRWAEMLVKLGLSSSKIRYKLSPPKRRTVAKMEF
ncbi:MAG: aspartate/glutamate racemase family protein [Candidatus Bathyarchaeia archaeon]